ncbi:MAG TPA: M15 family metallopeptidase [Gammaproteobacteria bacterium]
MKLEELGITHAELRMRGLHPHPEAKLLQVAEVGKDGREHLLIPEAAEAWRRLKFSAAQDGVTLFIVSAFRSVARQAEIIDRKLKSGLGIEEIIKVNAPPGYSEHHTGRVVDLSTPGVRPLEIEFETTPAFAWLQRNATQFGFVLSYPPGNHQGYQYEPWHWNYRPGLLCDAGRRSDCD